MKTFFFFLFFLLSSSALSSLFGASPSIFQSVYLPLLSFPLFSPAVTLKVFFLCLFSHTELSASLPSPSLPPFSLASSVSLPWDSRPLCSRYRPIDFGRERKYCGHDSPCMNLMIPALSAPSFSMEKQADKALAIFISLSSGMSVIRSTDEAN